MNNKVLKNSFTKKNLNQNQMVKVASEKIAFSSDDLSEKFLCTKLTIIRNLKKNIGENKYKFLINNNKSKVLNSGKSKNSSHQEIVNKLENTNPDNLSNESENSVDKNQKIDFHFKNP